MLVTTTLTTQLTIEKHSVQMTGFLGLDWTSVGVIGGAAYAVYQTLSTNQIKTAILELKLSIQERLSTIEQRVAVNYEKHATLAGTVKDLQDQIVQLHKDIAFRDGLLEARREEGGDPAH